MNDDEKFNEEASREQRGFLSEFVQFAMRNKKWWLVPIFLAILVFGILVVVGGSGAAPFIYTLF